MSNEHHRQVRKVDIRERTFSFACRIVKLYQFLEKQNNAGEVLGKQILKAGTSIGANLEEASGAQSKADFISKCGIALKEARETCYWLKLLKESKVVSPQRINTLLKESDEIVAILATIVKNSRRNQRNTVKELNS